MLLLDVMIRYSTVTLLLVMAALCVRDARHTVQGRLGALTGVAIAAVLLTTAPNALQLPEPLFTIVKWVNVANLALLWLFGLSLFRDDFKFGKLEWAGFIVYTGIVGLIRLHDMGAIKALPQNYNYLAPGFSAILVAHLIWTAVSGRPDDLIESRRKGRLWFAMGLALAAGISIFAEALYYPVHADMVSLIRAAVTLPMILWAVIWLAELRPERLLFDPRSSGDAPAPGAIDPKDSVTHSRLISLMEQERYYMQQGLTIRSLSAHMKVPEHQLRILINQGLGYRNFAAFLNSYRLGYAKDVLADPAQARLPILTIAMDAGFNSLAPFNRAFKSAEGITPSAYRKEKLTLSDRS